MCIKSYRNYSSTALESCEDLRDDLKQQAHFTDGNTDSEKHVSGHTAR